MGSGGGVGESACRRRAIRRAVDSRGGYPARDSGVQPHGPRVRRARDTRSCTNRPTSARAGAYRRGRTNPRYRLRHRDRCVRSRRGGRRRGLCRRDRSRGTRRAACRGQGRRRGLRHVRFVVMDSRALRFPAGSFDAVLSGFGHPLIERRRCLEEVHRVVGTRGRFALCTWNPVKALSKATFVVVREMLERRRPAVVAPDVARLIEARKILASTEEGKETQSADGWIRLFRSAGLSSAETVEETHWAAFRGPDAYLEYSFAWGDNERELRHMTAEDREAFRREFRERVTPLMTDEGLIVDWNLRYFLVRE